MKKWDLRFINLLTTDKGLIKVLSRIKDPWKTWILFYELLLNHSKQKEHTISIINQSNKSLGRNKNHYNSHVNNLNKIDKL